MGDVDSSTLGIYYLDMSNAELNIHIEDEKMWNYVPSKVLSSSEVKVNKIESITVNVTVTTEYIKQYNDVEWANI